MKEEWIKQIKIDMIPEAYREVAELIGIQNLLNLAKSFGGTMMYVPKADSLTKSIRDISIKSEFNGSNYKELALKYNLSESTIRNIMNISTLPGQITMFE